jgi:molybdopterin/thiamine biosynthesis adenylyltransferase
MNMTASNKKESNFFSKDLTVEERNLYDRQFRLDGWNQKILKESKVLIVGVGGLGCEIAKNLAMVGVGNIYLVDIDTIEHSNLNRQFLFVNAEMGESKAKVAARELKKINPTINIKGFHTSLEQLQPRAYKYVDLIIGGLDSVNARLNLNAQAVRFKKPLIDGGVSQYNGHIYTTFPYENACYECYAVAPQDMNDMNACTVVGNPRKRIHCLLKAQMSFLDEFGRDPNAKSEKEIQYIQLLANDMVEKHNFPPIFEKNEIVKLIDQHEPGIITINSIIASLQSHEAIKVLNYLKGNKGLGIPNKQYVIYNGMTLKFYYLDKTKNPKCPQCGESVKREEIEVNLTDMSQNIIDTLISRGYHEDPEMVPILTVQGFDSIIDIDLEETIKENRLRNLELITVAGFTEGEMYITLKVKK